MNSLPQRSQVLDFPVDRVTLIQTREIIKQLIRNENRFASTQSGRTHQIITLNSLMANQSLRDKEMSGILKRADLVIADSFGIFRAAKFLGEPLPEIIPGIELMLELCKMSESEGCSIYLLGTKKEIIEETARQLKKIFPQLKIVGYHHGYFSSQEEKEIIREIREFSPDILFVGLGSPQQEKWISTHLQELNVRVAIGIGGSFDVISHKLKRAPVFMRQLNLEWLYRCYQEPSRIKRIIQLPVFVFRVVLSRILTK